MDEQIYPVAPTDEMVDFSVGIARTGESVLVGVLYPGLVGVFFDGSGAPSRLEERELDAADLMEFRTGTASKSDLRDLYRAGLSEWLQGIGFVPGRILVKAFAIKGGQIGVSHMPREFERGSRAPTQGPASEPPIPLEDIDEWIRSGMFVLRWGKEYFMDATGVIDST
jgi:hypothetical protein